MAGHSYLTILSLAFGAGMLHALDADHIMTITSLSGMKNSFRSSVKYCAHWAIGHGSVLLLLGAAVMLLGMIIPPELSQTAETLVGVVLIVIGAGIVIDIFRKRAHLHFHQHDDLSPHAHWHQHHPEEQHEHASHQHHHRAVFIGMLHGAAGSAPLLALLPISQLHDPLRGLAYLLVFGLGTLVSMLFFGGVLGTSMRWLQRYGQRTMQGIRLTIGIGAIVFGAVWIQASI
jgi:sulfite exporter TauE/SafE